MNHFRDGMLIFIYLMGIYPVASVAYQANQAWPLIIMFSLSWPLFIPMVVASNLAEKL